MTKPKADRTSAETITRQSSRVRRPRATNANAPNSIAAKLAAAGGGGSGTPRGTLYGMPSNDTDPAEVLLNEIRRTAGHIEWLSGNLRNSDPHQFVRGLWLAKRQSGFIKEEEIDTSDLSQAGAMWLDLYLTERRHLATICRTALAAGIEERRVRLAERQAERVSEAIRGIMFDIAELYGIEIDPENDEVRAVIYKWLMQASGAAPERSVHPVMRLEIEPGE